MIRVRTFDDGILGTVCLGENGDGDLVWSSKPGPKRSRDQHRDVAVEVARLDFGCTGPLLSETTIHTIKDCGTIVYDTIIEEC